MRIDALSLPRPPDTIFLLAASIPNYNNAARSIEREIDSLRIGGAYYDSHFIVITRLFPFV